MEQPELEPFRDTPLTITDFVRYQGASGDMNPMHHDHQFARAAGYPQPFAVGMYAAGVLASYVAEMFGPANARRFKVQFRGQAWPGDELTYRGRIVSQRREHGEHLIDLELEVIRQTGDAHLRGWATFARPDEDS